MDGITIGVRAGIKAMNEVIIPTTVAAQDSYGTEQAHLVRDLLAFIEQRIGFLGDKQYTETLQSLAIADLLLSESDLAELESAARLRCAVAGARDVLSSPASVVSGHSVVEAARQLRSAIRTVLGDLDQVSDETRRRAERIVVQTMASTIQLDRAWLAPFGFDPSPESVQPLDEILMKNR